MLKQLLEIILIIIFVIFICNLFESNQQNMSEEEFKNMNYRDYDLNNEEINKNGWNIRHIGLTHDDCYSLSPKNCLRYSNCGLCSNNKLSNRKCLPGDEHGPFFSSDCSLWKHNNYYDGIIYNENKIRNYQPWNVVPTHLKSVYVDPISRATL